MDLRLTAAQLELMAKIGRENRMQEYLDDEWEDIKVRIARLDQLQGELDRRRFERRRDAFRPSSELCQEIAYTRPR